MSEDAGVCGIILCEQPNGEIIRLEYWILRQWQYGELKDPMLCAILQNAVSIRWER